MKRINLISCITNGQKGILPNLEYSREREYTIRGYFVYEEITKMAGKKETICVNISPEEDFLPEIKYDQKAGFTVEAKEHGSLMPEDVRAVIEQYETALYVMSVIEEELKNR